MHETRVVCPVVHSECHTQFVTLHLDCRNILSIVLALSNTQPPGGVQLTSHAQHEEAAQLAQSLASKASGTLASSVERRWCEHLGPGLSLCCFWFATLVDETSEKKTYCRELFFTYATVDVQGVEDEC